VAAAEALTTVEEFFGEIPGGVPAPRVAPAAIDPGPKRLMIEDRVELARLYLSWRTPGLFEPGDAELDLVGDLVGNGRTSRLYKRLIHDRRIAVELAAGQTSRELGGTFQIVASAAPGRTLDEVESAIRDELDQFAATGPTADEVDRGRVQAEAAFLFRVQSLGGFGGKADQLNAYNVYRSAPDSFDADLSRYLQAGADDLRASAATWLDPGNAVALSVVPRGRPELALAGAEPVMKAG